jgi:hypothetical protein
MSTVAIDTSYCYQILPTFVPTGTLAAVANAAKVLLGTPTTFSQAASELWAFKATVPGTNVYTITNTSTGPYAWLNITRTGATSGSVSFAGLRMWAVDSVALASTTGTVVTLTTGGPPIGAPPYPWFLSWGGDLSAIVLANVRFPPPILQTYWTLVKTMIKV